MSPNSARTKGDSRPAHDLLIGLFRLKGESVYNCLPPRYKDCDIVRSAIFIPQYMPVSTETPSDVDHAYKLRAQCDKDRAPSVMKEFIFLQRGLDCSGNGD